MTVASVRFFALGFVLAAALLAVSPADRASAQGDRYDRRMVVINETGRIINNLYATNTGTKYWGRDLLGQNIIRPGERYLVDFNDGTGYCLFDFRAVLDNGRPIEQYKVNVCHYSTWTVR
jgi:hypothetical protein